MDELHHYEKEYSLLKADIMKMVSLVLDSFDMAAKAFASTDINLARKVVELDDIIDEVNREIENLVLDLIARFRPFGKELRYVITSLKFAIDLERIADHAVNFAQQTISLVERKKDIEYLSQVRTMFGEVLEMLQDGVKAFTKKDIDTAVKVWKNDDKIDNLYFEIIDKVKQSNDQNFIVLNLLIARDLERVADHVTNLCEEIVFIETGKELRELV